LKHGGRSHPLQIHQIRLKRLAKVQQQGDSQHSQDIAKSSTNATEVSKGKEKQLANSMEKARETPVSKVRTMLISLAHELPELGSSVSCKYA
jgi:hypothetical protein